jgi:N4-(beta-N-acetylglucosaminyl)-L-asparaginase
MKEQIAMSKSIDRRGFLGSMAALLAAGRLADAAPQRSSMPEGRPAVSQRTNPVAVGSANALRTLEHAMGMLEDGGRPVDAVVDAVGIVEADPSDHSVGLGGIPNEQGEVELDASVMDGSRMRAGAVAALRNIVHPAQVAKLVMERTSRVLLVGQGALQFARAHGLEETELLTEEARKIWLFWKEKLNDRDDWVVGEKELEDPVIKKFYQRHADAFWPQGTIHLSMLGRNSDLAGCTTTSGLYFKLPGRVGDSPIIGAGLYVDGEVGAAGSTGWGEGNLQTLGCYNVVEGMRRGRSPESAALLACKRVVDSLIGPRVKHQDAPSRWNVTYYAVNAKGQTGAASIWSGKKYAVWENGNAELRDAAFLFERS